MEWWVSRDIRLVYSLQRQQMSPRHPIRPISNKCKRPPHSHWRDLVRHILVVPISNTMMPVMHCPDHTRSFPSPMTSWNRYRPNRHCPRIGPYWYQCIERDSFPGKTNNWNVTYLNPFRWCDTAHRRIFYHSPQEHHWLDNSRRN